MSDEERWGVPPGRIEALASHNTSVRNNGRDDAILYYPGSGTDILHALFAAGAKARYFIFVDPADLDQSMSAHLKEKHSRLNTTEASPILGNLGISSRSAGGWMFSMQGRMRYLFHFRMAHDAFVAANRGFVCDIVFEKDFWETPDDVDLGDVLAMLRIGGHYSTNASLGILIPAMPLVGLDYVNTYQINGNQSLFRRRTATRLNWNDLYDSLKASRQVVYGLIDDEESALYYSAPQDEVAIATGLTNKKAEMLEPFKKKGITVPEERCNPLCRQIAIWAVGGAAQHYIGGINQAFRDL